MTKSILHLLMQTIQKSLIQAIQKLVRLWGELFTFVTGEIELKKCAYYSVEWNLDCKENPHILHQKNTTSVVDYKGIEIKLT